MPEIFCCDFIKRPKGRRGWSFCISLFLPDCPPEPSMCKKSLCAKPSRWSSCLPRAGRLRAGHRAGGEIHLPRIQEWTASPTDLSVSLTPSAASTSSLQTRPCPPGTFCLRSSRRRNRQFFPRAQLATISRSWWRDPPGKVKECWWVAARWKASSRRCCRRRRSKPRYPPARDRATSAKRGSFKTNDGRTSHWGYSDLFDHLRNIQYLVLPGCYTFWFSLFLFEHCRHWSWDEEIEMGLKRFLCMNCCFCPMQWCVFLCLIFLLQTLRDFAQSQTLRKFAVFWYFCKDSEFSLRVPQPDCNCRQLVWSPA